jgi:hypothetical protein
MEDVTAGFSPLHSIDNTLVFFPERKIDEDLRRHLYKLVSTNRREHDYRYVSTNIKPRWTSRLVESEDMMCTCHNILCQILMDHVSCVLKHAILESILKSRKHRVARALTGFIKTVIMIIDINICGPGGGGLTGLPVGGTISYMTALSWGEVYRHHPHGPWGTKTLLPELLQGLSRALFSLSGYSSSKKYVFLSSSSSMEVHA